MNTKIARIINEVRRDGRKLEDAGNAIVDAHNSAVKYGFLDLPMLGFVSAEYLGDRGVINVVPESGMVKIDDLYNIKQAWGADGLEVYIDDNSAIGLIFNRK